MRIGGGKEGMIDSCIHTTKSKNILYRPRQGSVEGEERETLLESRVDG